MILYFAENNGVDISWKPYQKEKQAVIQRCKSLSTFLICMSAQMYGTFSFILNRIFQEKEKKSTCFDQTLTCDQFSSSN